MRTTNLALAAISLFQALTPGAECLGINCRGSFMCKVASWQSKSPKRISQALRDAIWLSPKANHTMYQSGEHIICVTSSLGVSNEVGAQTSDGPTSSLTLSGKINTGGICVFPQGSNVTLGLVRGLSDKLLQHGCGTCGSVPIKFLEGSNDPGPGILTYNYVNNPDCTGQCIGADGNASDPNQTGVRAPAKERRDLVDSAKFRFDEEYEQEDEVLEG